MKINRIFVVLMAVIFIGSQPMAVLAEDVSNEIEDVSNETEELLNETEDVANETENVSDEAETVSDETAESAGLRDQSGFVENSFRFSIGQPIHMRSASGFAFSDTSNAYIISTAFAKKTSRKTGRFVHSANFDINTGRFSRAQLMERVNSTINILDSISSSVIMPLISFMSLRTILAMLSTNTFSMS